MNVKELIAINAELMEQISALQTLFQLEANFWNDHEISKNASMAKLIEEKDKEITALKSQLDAEHGKHQLLKKQLDIVAPRSAIIYTNNTNMSQIHLKDHCDSVNTISAIPFCDELISWLPSHQPVTVLTSSGELWLEEMRSTN